MGKRDPPREIPSPHPPMFYAYYVPRDTCFDKPSGPEYMVGEDSKAISIGSHTYNMSRVERMQLADCPMLLVPADI